MLGTPAYEQLVAIEAAAEFLMSVGMATVQEYEPGVSHASSTG